MHIESMHVYPVKSMRGIPVERTILTASGLLGDRRFMVVDPDGQFIRQWVPELSGLNKRDIHDPSALGGLFAPSGYPRPIVDLSRSRERALTAFKNLSTKELPA